MPFVGANIGVLVTNRAPNVQNTATVLAWLLWAVTIFAVAVLHPISLTVLRMTTPTVAIFLIAVLLDDLSVSQNIISALLSIAVLLLSFNADIGNLFVQASAYGDEKRFLLRPPVVLIAPVVLVCTLLMTLTVFSPLFIAAKNLPVGLTCAVLAMIGFWFFARRIHQFSRRWFVFVPAGFVVHDETLLGTNLMIRKSEMSEVKFAKQDTQAADLTALTWGVPLELQFTAPQDVTLTRISSRYLKSLDAIHASSILIAPSRPGAVIRHASIKTNS